MANEYLPSFVFTDQVPAQQLIAQSRLMADRQASEQLRAMQAVREYQDAQARRQELANRSYIQQAQLSQQQAAMAQQQRQFEQEAELRKAMQAADITGRKDLLTQQLGIYDKYPQLLQPKGMAEVNAALADQIAGQNLNATTEEGRLNAMLAPIKAERDKDLADIQDVWNNPWSHPIKKAWAATLGSTTKHQYENRKLKYQQAVAALIQANPTQNATYDPVRDTFVAVKRAGPTTAIPTPQSRLNYSVDQALADLKNDFDMGTITPDEAIARYNYFTGKAGP